ncbi:MAG TPA: LysR family transcriptional regulator [Rubrivivax sp.]|nr:LysR family transcriptional regulator [Rubrivivax sp.]
MNDRIRELDFFLRVTEEQSFSAAARSLDLDPSTISKIVQRLENRLGVRLFHRTSRVLKLTQEGERFLSAAQKVMLALEEAEESLSPALIEASGVLRIGSTQGFARFWLTPLLPAFCEKHPKLKLELVLSPTPPNLFEQQIDLSFQSGSIPDSTLVARRIASVHWRVYAAPAYLERFGTPRTPDELMQHRCLNFLPGSYRSQWPMKEDGAVRNVSPGGPVSASDGDVLVALAVAGMGLVRLIDMRAERDAPKGSLVRVLEGYEADPEPIYAVYPSRRHLSLRVRALLDHLAEHLSDT